MVQLIPSQLIAVEKQMIRYVHFVGFATKTRTISTRLMIPFPVLEVNRRRGNRKRPKRWLRRLCGFETILLRAEMSVVRTTSLINLISGILFWSLKKSGSVKGRMLWIGYEIPTRMAMTTKNLKSWIYFFRWQRGNLPREERKKWKMHWTGCVPRASISMIRMPILAPSTNLELSRQA